MKKRTARMILNDTVMVKFTDQHGRKCWFLHSDNWSERLVNRAFRRLRKFSFTLIGGW